jgi:hypothetical protein
VGHPERYICGMIVDRLRMAASVVIFSGAVAAALGAQGTVSLLGYTAAVPAGWVTAPSTSSMRLAQYTIPGRDGSVAAEVVVYFFGNGQGGNVTANLERWKGQFSTPDGTPVFEKVARDSSGAFPVTVAEYRGTYARGIGAGDAANAKPGQSLIAAIAETPRGTLFFQLFGATASVTPQREALIAFVSSLRTSAETGGGSGGCEVGDGFECVMITGHEGSGPAEHEWARAILLWRVGPRGRGRVAFDTVAVRIAQKQNVVARRAAEEKLAGWRHLLHHQGPQSGNDLAPCAQRDSCDTRFPHACALN